MIHRGPDTVTNRGPDTVTNLRGPDTVTGRGLRPEQVYAHLITYLSKSFVYVVDTLLHVSCKITFCVKNVLLSQSIYWIPIVVLTSDLHLSTR